MRIYGLPGRFMDIMDAWVDKCIVMDAHADGLMDINY